MFIIPTVKLERDLISDNLQYKKEHSKRIAIKDVILGMLSLTMLVDFANGMLVGLHLGEIFRILLLVICTFYLLKSGSEESIIYFCILLYLALNVSLASIIYKTGFMTNVSMALKSCIFYAVFFALIVMYKRHKVILEDVESIIKKNIYYAPALFIVTYAFGIGNASYNFGDQNLGFKSGFMSLNSVNIALMVLYIFSVYSLFDTKTIKWLLLSLYVAIPMAMLGTKTGYAIIVVIPIFFLLLSLKRKSTWGILFLGLVGVAVLVRPFISRVLPLFRDIIKRQLTLYDQRDFWTFLTSTRNLRVSNVLSIYFDNSSPVSLLFGSGYFWVHSIAAGLEISTGKVIPLEMDWADLFVTYGIIGVSFTYIFVVTKIIKSRKLWRNKGSGTAFFWLAVILLLYGTFAGHLFFEAISSTFFGIVLAGLYMARKKSFLF